MSYARMTFLAIAISATLAAPALAQVRAVEGFADLTDLTLASPVIVEGVVAKSDKISAKQAPGLGAGRQRLLVETQVTSLLRSPAAVPARISYLWDAPLDARGKAPAIKKAPVLLFLAAGARAGEYRLTSAQGQIAATPAALAKVRAILSQGARPELRGLRITGVGNAFRVPGSLPGEAESQIFLTTADGRPLSIVVLSRPGQRRAYSVAIGDVIDEAAKPVPRDTLLWYEMACRLPRALPASSTEAADPAAREGVEDDYRFVLSELGPCGRTLS